MKRQNKVTEKKKSEAGEEEAMKGQKRITRREMLGLSGTVAAGSVLAAYGVTVAQTPVPPTVAPVAAPAAQGSQYAAVSPLGQSTVTLVRPSPPIPDLKGKLIGIVDVEFGGMRSQTFMRAMEALCLERIPGVKVVELPSNLGGVWHSRPQDGTTGQVAKTAKCDAVIVGIGG